MNITLLYEEWKEKLDEITRLNVRVQELEDGLEIKQALVDAAKNVIAELKLEVKKLECVNLTWMSKYTELEAEQKAFCTTDGDYPEENRMVLFDDGDDTYIGGYDPKAYLWFTNDDEWDNTKNVDPVYWKYLTPIKSNYKPPKEE